MIAKILSTLRVLKCKFFKGPALFNHPGRNLKGYKSVNIMVAHWIRSFVLLHFTLPGRVLFLLTCYVLLTSMLTLLMPLYLLAFTLVSLFITNVIVGWIFRPKIEIRRTVPDLVPSQSLVRLHYQIHNLGKRACWDLVVDPVPPGSAFSRLHPPSTLKEISPGESLYVSHRLTAKKRGKHLLPHPIAGSAFPFGLFRWSSIGAGNKSLKVYPHFSPLEEFNLGDNNFCQYAENEALSRHGGQSMEFHGVREFRDGDNPRFIHAPSWARLGIPIVKEFSDEGSRPIGMIVDTYSKKKGVNLLQVFRRKENPELESVLTLAAACTEFFVRKHYQLDVFINSADAFHHLKAQESGQLEAVLELLAEIESSPHQEFRGLPLEKRQEITDFSCVISLFLEWDDGRARFVADLEKQRVITKVICVGKKEQFKAPPTDGITLLSTSDVLGGKVVRL